MVRDLDEVVLTLSLWKQARQELQQLEERLMAVKASGHAAATAELHELERLLSTAQSKTESLLDQALHTLRRHNASRAQGN
jgi:hypothetical protein